MKRAFSWYSLCLCIGYATVSLAQQLPIKPTRTITFTTDEGSNMNVDVSSDGKTLVFDLLGDLYTVPVTGGTAIQLTHGIAFNVQPQWSPDGKKIACFSDISGIMHLTVRNSDGTFQRTFGIADDQLDINHNIPFKWSPDGNSIVMDGYVYGVTGGKLPTPLPKDTTLLLRFSADSRTLFYVDRIDSNKIFKYDPENKSRVGISKSLNKFSTGELSPDTRWWVFTADSNEKRGLIVRNLQSGVERILLSALGEHPILLDPHFSFSPNSKYIYICYRGKIHRIEVESGTDKVIPFIANVRVDMGPLVYNTFSVSQEPFKVKYTRSANVSPDGKYLVFEALDRIYIMDLPNGKPHILIPQAFNQFQPAFSPDSKWVAYVSWCDTSAGQLWRVSNQGGKPQQITIDAAQYQRPAWSPDGKTIAVIKGGVKLGSRDDPGRGQLQLLQVGDGSIHVVADSIPLWNQLTFSANGKRITYEPRIIMQKDASTHFFPMLVSSDINGMDKRTEILGRVDEDQVFLQRTLSPDGRYLVFSRSEDLYLVPTCDLLKPAILFDESKNNTSAIRFASGVDPQWEKGGKTLSWSYGNKFYRIDPAKIMFAAELQAQNDLIVRVNVKPDQIINLDVTAPVKYAKGTIALKNVRIVTMQSNKVIEKGTVIIKNGRFAQVGSIQNVLIPQGCKVFDLKGKTIIPGFVDVHLHMGIAPDVFPQQAWQYMVNLAYGVTTARDPSSSYDSFGYTELLKTGQMLGPRLFSSGRAVRLGDGVWHVDSQQDADGIVKKRAKMGGTFMKQYLLPSRRQREWLLLASKANGLNMTNEGDMDLQLELGQIKDGSSGVEHNPGWGNVYKDIVSFYGKSGTYFTPTLQVTPMLPSAKDYFNYKYWHHPDEKFKRFYFNDHMMRGTNNGPESFDFITKNAPHDTTVASFVYSAKIDAAIRHAGGKIALGSHGNDEGIGVHNELWALQMGGLTNMQALQAATIIGAEAIGIQKDVGSIEVGKLADLIILNSNPLKDIHSSRDIMCVMKDGILYDGDTLDEIWPIKKKCPDWRLQNKDMKAKWQRIQSKQP